MTLPADAPVRPVEIDLVLAPPPDPGLEPAGYLAGAEGEARIHFLDWGGPEDGRDDGPGVLLVPGLLSPAWSWAPVARRLARVRRTVVMDLRGHGLSDAPPDGYDLDTLADDAALVAESSGIVSASEQCVIAGHGFGACVAAAAATKMGEWCAGLLLVDGGIERLGETSGLDADELLRSLEEPPEVLRSMNAWLDDRRAFDEATWDDDQERTARDAVVETAAGHVVRAVRPFVLTALVPTMLAYDPAVVLARVSTHMPVTALVAMAAGDPGPRLVELRRAAAARVASGGGAVGVVGFEATAHNLPRYRPAEVTAAILGTGA
jgi:pimeloyl-ACP methyl ester carboxylesterase